MHDQYNYDLIRDYLHGIVDKESARQVAELIARDETARSIAEGILILEKNFNSEAEVNTYLEQVRQKQFGVIASQNNTGKTPFWMKVAASILLVAMIGFVVQLKLRNDSIAIVDEELSNPYPVSNLVRGSSESSSLEKALDLYSQKKYTEALSFFQQVPDDSADPATRQFYHGLTHLYTGNYSAAARLLEGDVIEASRYAQQARWASALAAMKVNDEKKARKILTLISKDETHYKHQSAITLLDSLD